MKKRLKVSVIVTLMVTAIVSGSIIAVTGHEPSEDNAEKNLQWKRAKR